MKIFVTGISTDVGKTISAAILVEALQADYWKPIQSGDLEHSDKNRVRDLISNSKTIFHQSSYEFQNPFSPHKAARLEQTTIDIDLIKEPSTENHLIIEGVGGILVPLNNEQTILDLIQQDYQTIIVSRHYLGSINHTLLTYEVLKSKNISVLGIIFSGNEDPDTESIILSKTGLKMIGRIDDEPYFDKNVIIEYAAKFRL